MPVAWRRLRRTLAALGCGMLALGFGACAGGQPKADPTSQEWDRAVEEPGEAAPRSRLPELDPKLAHPDEGAVIDRAELEREGGAVLFSWSVAGPQSRYQLEIAADRAFEKILVTRKSGRNVLAYRPRVRGPVFWRVKTERGLVSNTRRLVFEP